MRGRPGKALCAAELAASPGCIKGHL